MFMNETSTWNTYTRTNKKIYIPNQTTQTYPIFGEKFRTHTDTKTNHLISLIPDSIGPEALPGKAKNQRTDDGIGRRAATAGGEGGREEEENGEKKP